MARSLRKHELEDLGFTPEEIEAILEKQNTPAPPQAVYWRFKATTDQAREVASAHPDLEFEKAYSRNK